MSKSNINNGGDGSMPPVPELQDKPPADLGRKDTVGGDVASLLLILDSDIQRGILSGNGISDGDLIAPGSDIISKKIEELEWLVSVLRVWRVWDPLGKAALPCGYLRDIAGLGVRNFNCLVGHEDQENKGVYISVRIERSASRVHSTVHDKENDKPRSPRSKR